MSPNEIPPEIYERAEILMDQFRHIEDDRELIARVLMEVGQGASSAGLTEIQSDTLEFVTSFQDRHRYAPSYDEIAKAVGLASKSGAHRVIHQLVERGVISLLPHRARSLNIVGRA